jgi:hypothetical protein
VDFQTVDQSKSGIHLFHQGNNALLVLTPAALAASLAFG